MTNYKAYNESRIPPVHVLCSCSQCRKSPAVSNRRRRQTVSVWDIVGCTFHQRTCPQQRTSRASGRHALTTHTVTGITDRTLYHHVNCRHLYHPHHSLQLLLDPLSGMCFSHGLQTYQESHHHRDPHHDSCQQYSACRQGSLLQTHRIVCHVINRVAQCTHCRARSRKQQDVIAWNDK